MSEKNKNNKFFQAVYHTNKVMSKVESYFSMILLWALIIVTMIFISCRFVFHISTPWADELARYLLIILAWVGGSYAASVGDHLEIDIISTVLRKKTKNAEKIISIIDRIGQCVVLAVMVFFIYRFVLYMGVVGSQGVSSTTMGFSMVLPMAFVLIGCILITLHTIFNILLPRDLWFAHEEEKVVVKEGEE